MATKPEQSARQAIDQLLHAAGWVVCDRAQTNLFAARGVAVREFPMKQGFGLADYMLYVDGAAVGVIEAKKEGRTLLEVELQSKYSEGLPESLPGTQPFAFPKRIAITWRICQRRIRRPTRYTRPSASSATPFATA